MLCDILVRNAFLIDGSGAAGRVAHVAISGDRIEAVGELRGMEAPSTIDAAGLTLAPGFIDIHSHSDFHLLVEPRCEGKVRQGVTTEVIGNCGVSAAPLAGMAKKRRAETLSDIGLAIDWSTLEEYGQALEREGMGINCVPLVGHGNLRGSVLGFAARQPSEAEMETMRRMLEDSLELGAWGLSTGLIYPPGVYAETGELLELARVVARHGGVYTSHLRSEGDEIEKALDEAFTIGEGAEISIQISHLKVLEERNWHKMDRVLERIEEARSSGLKIHADCYPYTAASTDLDSLLPPWVFEGGSEAQIKRLSERSTRRAISEEICGDLSHVADRVRIVSAHTSGNEALVGKSLKAISDMRGQPLTETLMDVLVEEKLKVAALFFFIDEENTKKTISRPYVVVGSDSASRADYGLLRRGLPHPRGFGTFPRVISRYAREQKLLSVEEAIFKMTFQVAQKLGLRKRGIVKEGSFADLILFDLERIRDKATYEDPFVYPEGIVGVMVNGQWAVWEGRHTGVLAGRLLCRGREE